MLSSQHNFLILPVNDNFFFLILAIQVSGKTEDNYWLVLWDLYLMLVCLGQHGPEMWVPWKVWCFSLLLQDWGTEMLLVCMEGDSETPPASVRPLVSAQSWWPCATGRVSQRAWGFDPAEDQEDAAAQVRVPAFAAVLPEAAAEGKKQGTQVSTGKIHLGIRKKLLWGWSATETNAESWWDCCPWDNENISRRDSKQPAVGC